MVDVAAISYLFAASDRQLAYPYMPESAAQVAVERDSDSVLVAKHARLVRSLARQYSDGSNTEDLVQEGTLALLEARRSWREEAQFWTYARRFVLGAMVRYATAESSEPASPNSARVGEDGFSDDIESDTSSAEDALSTAECVSKLSNLMIHLSDTERRIVRQHIVDGDSLAAVARGLDWSNDKAERIYHGAIGKLRERMQAQL